MARLSARLGLTDEERDWGVVNGDAERLVEFVHIYARLMLRCRSSPVST